MKGPLPQAGEYTSDVLLEGLAAFLQDARPNGLDADGMDLGRPGVDCHDARLGQHDSAPTDIYQRVRCSKVDGHVPATETGEIAEKAHD